MYELVSDSVDYHEFYLHVAAVLDKSFEHAEKADVCLAMGSSLTVTPAADIPEVCSLAVKICS